MTVHNKEKNFFVPLRLCARHGFNGSVLRLSKVSESGVQNGCLGGLCSVITGIGKRLRRSATLQEEANTPCRTCVQNEGNRCPKWVQTIENGKLKVENEKTQNITFNDYPKYRSGCPK